VWVLEIELYMLCAWVCETSVYRLNDKHRSNRKRSKNTYIYTRMCWTHHNAETEVLTTFVILSQSLNGLGKDGILLEYSKHSVNRLPQLSKYRVQLAWTYRSRCRGLAQQILRGAKHSHWPIDKGTSTPISRVIVSRYIIHCHR